MVESLGKQLCKARLAKGLTIDEAAHETRLRPDKILALENDEYTRLGGTAYAKGFLQIYGKYLGVDTSEHTRGLEVPQYMNLEDYQYLNNAPELPRTRSRIRVPSRRDARPATSSILPLVAFAGVVVLMVFGAWISISAQRLGLDKASKRTTRGTATEVRSATAPAVPPAPAPAVAPAPASSDLSPVAEGLEAAPMPAANVTEPLPAASSTEPASAPGTQADSMNGPANSTLVIGGPGETNELIVEPVKKTWVKVRKDGPTGALVFEDYLYPGSRPLKLRGARFLVEVREENAVRIRKNGNPIAYQRPALSGR